MTQSLYSTDTTVVTYADSHEQHPAAHAALCDWLGFHGIDPRDVPAAGVIRRDPDACCVRYARIVRDHNGRVQAGPYGSYLLVEAVAQGETPPLPWPPEVAALPLDQPLTEPFARPLDQPLDQPHEEPA